MLQISCSCSSLSNSTSRGDLFLYQTTLVVLNSLIYRGLGFLKSHKRGGDQDFLVKMGEEVHVGGFSIEGSKHCFTLTMYGFCSSNGLYSASLSFRIFIFISTLFDTWDCYFFRLNLSLVLLVKVFFIKKHATLLFSLLKMNK